MEAFTGNTPGPPGARCTADDPARAGLIGVAVVCVAQFVVVLDATIVTTALPVLGAELGFDPAGLSWVITAYTLVLAVGLLPGGRLADVFGHRRLFRIGLLVFTAGSVACALAWSPATLVGARIAQGAGAALLAPAALATLTDLTSSRSPNSPAARRQALGWWTAVAAGGGASGWLLGGVITEFAGWRWVFAVNAPIGVLALALSLSVLPAARRNADDHATRGRLNTPAKRRTQPSRGQSLPGRCRAAWDFLRTPGVLGGNLTALALTGATTPAMYAVTLYVQDLLRQPPSRAALLFPAFNLAVITGSLLAPHGLNQLGVRRQLLIGFGGVLIGILLLTALPGEGFPVLLLISAFVLMGGGLGSASVASTSAGLAFVPGLHRGTAAGLLNSTAQLGTALGLAVATPVLSSAPPMTGYQLGFLTAASIAVAGVVSILTIPAAVQHRANDPASVAD